MVNHDVKWWLTEVIVWAVNMKCSLWEQCVNCVNCNGIRCVYTRVS
jgi:hypothetical protein